MSNHENDVNTANSKGDVLINSHTPHTNNRAAANAGEYIVTDGIPSDAK